MLVELSIEEIILIREATTSYGLTPPVYVSSNEKKLKRWRENIGLYEDERISVKDKMTDILVEEFDKKNGD